VTSSACRRLSRRWKIDNFSHIGMTRFNEVAAITPQSLSIALACSSSMPDFNEAAATWHVTDPAN
jgi:hypothetical protein